jgi:hypothetical protein
VSEPRGDSRCSSHSQQAIASSAALRPSGAICRNKVPDRRKLRPGYNQINFRIVGNGFRRGNQPPHGVHLGRISGVPGKIQSVSA